MKLLSDYKGEEALDVLADIIEPLCIVFADKEIQELNAKAKKERKIIPPIQYIKPALKNHKEEILSILARIEGVPVEEYKETVNIVTLPIQILSVVNDPNIKSLFQSQSQNDITSLASSGSAIVNTEAEEN